MFGVVPKPLWNRKSPGDDQNRIQLDTNCLLIRTPDALVLCDTGFGSKLSEKERKHIDAGPRSLVENLANKGVVPDELTHIVFSHLHFDHAGGATVFDSQAQDEMQVTFRNAEHVVQKRELEDALGNVPELAGNYYEPELRFLFNNAATRLVDGDEELIPSIQVRRTGGHTFGHQTIWVHSQGNSGVYLGDICPTVGHLNVFWTMAYDAYQLEVRRQKFTLLSQIAADKTIVFFDHDPDVKAATIRVKNDKAFEIDEIIEMA